MKTTIDGAGRIVIPKALRDDAGLRAGSEVEIALRDGRIEIAPTTPPMRLVPRERGATIETDADVPLLSAEEVRDVLEGVRR